MHPGNYQDVGTTELNQQAKDLVKERADVSRTQRFCLTFSAFPTPLQK